MTAEPATYEERYLAGIVLFNRHDFFEAHEVWEDLWHECAGPERRFYQGLIQAAVGLLHFSNGNLRGAIKLYGTSRAYMERYASPFLGLDIAKFWQGMEECFAPLLATPLPATATLDAERIPQIRLDPEPATWPDPEAYLAEEEGA